MTAILMILCTIFVSFTYFSIETAIIINMLFVGLNYLNYMIHYHYDDKEKIVGILYMLLLYFVFGFYVVLRKYEINIGTMYYICAMFSVFDLMCVLKVYFENAKKIENSVANE